jgi:LacI family transcriptional regulator
MNDSQGLPPTKESGAYRRVTMTDVARVAGCSQATVSFVLNESPGVKISDRTRQRVIEAARSLNYAMAPLAHLVQPGLAANAPPVIGFLVDQLATSPEAVVAIDGARLSAWEDGRLVLSAQTMNDPEIEEQTIRTFARQGMAGLVYMTIFTRRVTLPPVLADLTCPVVLLNCYTDGARYPAVIPAERSGGERITRHLIDHGHRRIGMITGEPWMEATRDRMKGFRRAVHDAGLPFDPTMVVQGNWSPSSGYEGTRRLMSLAEPPTAIFCQNDRMAVGCYEALKEMNLRIPEDVSVVGYDDEEIARHLNPQLTTIVLPHRAMGQWAVEMLGNARLPHADILPLEMEGALVARGSVATVADRIRSDGT